MEYVLKYLSCALIRSSPVRTKVLTPTLRRDALPYLANENTVKSNSANNVEGQDARFGSVHDINFRNTELRESTASVERSADGRKRDAANVSLFEYGGYADGAQRDPIARRCACAGERRVFAPSRPRGGLAIWTLAPTLQRGKRIRLDSVATKATSGCDRRSIGRSRATASATAAQQ